MMAFCLGAKLWRYALFWALYPGATFLLSTNMARSAKKRGDFDGRLRHHDQDHHEEKL